MEEAIKELVKTHYQDYLININDSIDIDTQFDIIKNKFCDLRDLINFLNNINKQYVQKLENIHVKFIKKSISIKTDLEQF
jgi:hypothetical protein